MLKSGDRVCTVGAGYVGVVSSAWFARWNPDIQFVVVDKDAERVKSWTSDGTLPIREPGLSSLIPQSNLSFSSEVAKEVAQAGWIFIAPHDLDLDLSCLYEALDLIARVCTHEHTVVIRSTVPPGTAEKATAFLLKNGDGGFAVLTNPELLAQGSAVVDFHKPDCVVVGCFLDDENNRDEAEALESLYRCQPILIMSHSSACMFKLANNALLAQRIGSVNSIAAICQKFNTRLLELPADADNSYGSSSGELTPSEDSVSDHQVAKPNDKLHTAEANIADILEALSLNSRLSTRGTNYFQISLGCGGSCLTKDTLQFAKLAESLGLSHLHSDFWRSIPQVNTARLSDIIRTLLPAVGGDLFRLIFGFVGYAYKAGTADTRGSLVQLLAQRLLDDGAAQIKIWDPLVDAAAVKRDVLEKYKHKGSSFVHVCRFAAEAFTDCSAVIVVNDLKAVTRRNEEFWYLIGKSMRGPKIVFDPRNCLTPEDYGDSHGIRFEQMGRARAVVGE